MMEEVPLPPLQKHGPGVRELILQGLKGQRYEDAPQFLLDLSQFLQMPIESLQTPENMLRIFIGEAERRMGEFHSNPVQQGTLQQRKAELLKRQREDAFVTDLGKFLAWYNAADALKERKPGVTRGEVLASVKQVLSKKVPTEVEKSDFLDRISQGFPTLKDLRLYDVNRSLLKSRAQTPKDHTKEAEIIIARPTEFIQYLERLGIFVQSKRTVGAIRQEADDTGVLFRQFDEKLYLELPGELRFVRTDDRRCLMIDFKRRLILCDPHL